jgi:hypothetical protein
MPDAGEPSVEARSTLNLDTERSIRNTGIHDFGWKCRLLFLAIDALPVCDWLAGRACCSGGETGHRCTARKGQVCICGDVPTGDFLSHPMTDHARLLHESKSFMTWRVAFHSLNARTTYLRRPAFRLVPLLHPWPLKGQYLDLTLVYTQMYCEQ